MNGCLVKLRGLNRSADLDSTVLLVKMAEQMQWEDDIYSSVSHGREPGFQGLQTSMCSHSVPVMLGCYVAHSINLVDLPIDNRRQLVKENEHPIATCSPLCGTIRGPR